MRAIILAGGKGTRLRPYTICIPKPLVPIGEDMPILEIVIRQLKKYGFDHVTIATSHSSNIIMAFFGDGKKWKIKIDYSCEASPLGTIGPLTLLDDLPDNFLLMNGDILTDLNYKKLFDLHIAARNSVTVASYMRTEKVDFGVIERNKQGKITSFHEKPEYNFCVSMGIYIIHKKVIDNLKKGAVYGFDDLMMDGIKNNYKMQSIIHNSYWLDIGRPSDYEQAQKEFPIIKKTLL